MMGQWRALCPFLPGSCEVALDDRAERPLAGSRVLSAAGSAAGFATGSAEAAFGDSALGLYIAAVDAASGKDTVALGVVEAVSRRARSVGFFRPVVRAGGTRDGLIELIRARYDITEPYEAQIGTSYDEVHLDPDGAIEEIVVRYRNLASRCDVVVAVGTDFAGADAATELGFNIRVAANLGLPVLFVVNGRDRTPEEIGSAVRVARQEAARQHSTELAVAVNRVDPGTEELVKAVVEAIPGVADPFVFVLPEVDRLTSPTVRDLLAAVHGTLLGGDERLLDREASGLIVAAMSLPNVLDRLTEGVAVIAPGDRTAGLVPGLLAAHQASTFPSLSAVVLTGGFQLPETVARLLDGLHSPLPIVSTVEDTLPTALHLAAVRGKLTADAQGKIDTALGMFSRSVDTSALLDRINVTRSTAVTPLMFQARLFERARSARRTIVLPESTDDRILRAADIVSRRDAADLILLGEEKPVRDRAARLGLDLSKVEIVDPRDEALIEEFAAEYTKLREHKGMTLDRARDVVTDVSYFGTLMVGSGRADGMVSGAVHTTAHTIRPAFEIIKTRPGTSIVSSVFFMCLADRVLVYGDCAVNPDPDARQLADIALSSAETARRFGVEPRVALLSYSTGESGTGREVDKVREATRLATEQRPDLPIDGPIQYDAASDPEVAALKMPGRPVAGRATVFIVPDLNTGNNLYKAVQRSAGAVAVGPVLQGLRKPVNDLSRGATVLDIVNTIVITAIQAQEDESS